MEIFIELIPSFLIIIKVLFGLSQVNYEKTFRDLGSGFIIKPETDTGKKWYHTKERKNGRRR